MDTLLGLLGVVAFMAGVIAMAAALTWVVVKLSPPKTAEREPEAQS